MRAAIRLTRRDYRRAIFAELEAVRLTRAAFKCGARESRQILVAGRVGVVSALCGSPICPVSTGGSGTNAHGDPRPHSAAHGRNAVDTGVMNAGAANTNTSPSSPVRESVSGDSRDAG